MLCRMDAVLPLRNSVLAAADDLRLDVCIVTETFPPEINGVARTMSCVVEGLRHRGHNVHVVRPRQDNEQPSPEETTLVPGIGLPLYKGLKLGLPARQTLRRLWVKSRPDVIYITTEGPLGLSAMREARFQRIPALSGFHTNFHSYSSHYRLGPLKQLIFSYLRYFHNRTACTVAPSPDLVARLRDLGFSTVAQVARGVDTQRFSPQHRQLSLRQSWGVREDELAALYVGRIAAEKNLDLAIRAFHGLQDRHPQAKFVLVGDGPLLDTLQRRHPEFHFCGMRTGLPLAEHYASADLLLFPSTTETFGNVVLEAMASGLPVLAYDYAAPRMHIRSGHNGFTVRLGDETRYLGACAEMAESLPQLRAAGAAARQTALGLGWEQVVQDFEKLLFEYIDQGEVEHEYA